MIPHAELALIAGRAYSGPQSRRFPFNVSVDFVPVDKGAEVVVTLPGTHPADALDWIRDATFWPAWFAGLGPLHAGFGFGAIEAWPYIDRELRRDALATYSAHSLGAAMAAILAALHAIHRPAQPFRLVTFGEPRVAFCNPWLGHLIRRGAERAIYARAGDLVPDAPTRPYLHGGRMTRIGASAGDFIADHAIALYAADLRAMGL
jgi:hypothetical protein